MGPSGQPTVDQVEAGARFEGAHLVPWEKDPRRHPQRAVERVCIRVEALPQLVDIGGYLCKAGVNYLLVYADEVDHIRETKVATDEQKRRLRDAEATFEIAFEAYAKTQPNREDARKTFGASPWMFYDRQVNGIAGNTESAGSHPIPGFPPLLSLEVCQDHIAPPLNPHSYAVDRDERLGAAVAKGVAAALATMKAPKG